MHSNVLEGLMEASQAFAFSESAPGGVAISGDAKSNPGSCYKFPRGRDTSGEQQGEGGMRLVRSCSRLRVLGVVYQLVKTKFSRVVVVVNLIKPPNYKRIEFNLVRIPN